MSILSALKHDLGVVEGILIPGGSATLVNLTHEIQQDIAKAYGPAITDLSTKLLASKSMTGIEKAAYITGAVVDDLLAKGLKADVAALKSVVTDVVSAAYKVVEPNIGTAIVALAHTLNASPALTEVATLAAPLIQEVADEALPKVDAAAPVADAVVEPAAA